jgi:adenylosuccinate synthase
MVADVAALLQAARRASECAFERAGRAARHRHGTYPYVTSSNCVAATAAPALHRAANARLRAGIVGAYTPAWARDRFRPS